MKHLEVKEQNEKCLLSHKGFMNRETSEKAIKALIMEGVNSIAYDVKTTSTQIIICNYKDLLKEAEVGTGHSL